MKAKLIRILLNLSARLPFSVSHRLGNWLGMLMQRFNNQQRHVAQINLNRCFPELDPVEQRQLLRDTLRETGKLLFESGHLWLGDEAHVSRLVQEVHGEEHIKNGLTSGKGVILAVPHLGNWEVLGVYCSSRYPMTSLYRPPRVEGIEILIRQARNSFGRYLPREHTTVPLIVGRQRQQRDPTACKLSAVFSGKNPRNHRQFRRCLGSDLSADCDKEKAENQEMDRPEGSHEIYPPNISH